MGLSTKTPKKTTFVLKISVNDQIGCIMIVVIDPVSWHRLCLSPEIFNVNLHFLQKKRCDNVFVKIVSVFIEKIHFTFFGN